MGHVSHDDSLALSEMRATSHPAPALPLTKEEKLLLRVAHIGGPKEFAILNPATRAKQEEEADVEFQQFFGEETARSNAQN